MGPTWVASAPGGSHVGPVKLDIRDRTQALVCIICIEHTCLTPTYQFINQWVADFCYFLYLGTLYTDT